jgi:hypothetical protein
MRRLTRLARRRTKPEREPEDASREQVVTEPNETAPGHAPDPADDAPAEVNEAHTLDLDNNLDAPLPLDRYRGAGGRGRIPQCPNCGRFDVDARQDDSAYEFKCQRCNHDWAWSVGQPWPTTRPRADLGEPSTKE